MWLRDPPGVKPGSKMPNLGLSGTEITNLVAYLQTLK
jgi:cytochrome c1